MVKKQLQTVSQALLCRHWPLNSLICFLDILVCFDPLGVLGMVRGLAGGAIKEQVCVSQFYGNGLNANSIAFP